ncbi:hypothetical protein [Idiomarina xiamenensis]|uniref:Uncharacterized protein n=1 Tax=Idiomarina xiamenensis 10-D-4 TaxID=740709 RepID=K2LCE1_9GAMM|nr:hypothetical protein [Idiomarina xiamenensis]EKE87535.1 hypothetical protein A10D4_00535 [Idiomarina xiamenensis 10-D-4]
MLPKSLPIKLSKKDREAIVEDLNRIDYMTPAQCRGALLRRYHELQHFYLNPPRSHIEARELQPRDFFVHFRAQDFLSFGYIHALIEQQPQLFLNALYSFNRYDQVIYNASGYDHGAFAWQVLIGYAANDDVYIDFMLPRSLPLTEGRVVCHIIVDCILALRNPDLKAPAVDSAERFLQCKRTHYERAMINALLGILTQDVERFNDALQASLDYHRRSQITFDRGLLKYMPVSSYGLLALAYRYFDNQQYQQIKHSKHDLWWSAFVAHNEQQGYRVGQHLIRFDGELSFMNDAESMMEVKHTSVAEMREQARQARREYAQRQQ